MNLPIESPSLENISDRIQTLHLLNRIGSVKMSLRRWVEPLAQVKWVSHLLRTKTIHDQEFKEFSQALDLAGVTDLLDIGANYGYSVTTLRNLGYSNRIISFEPLREHWPALAYLKLLDPTKFRFRLIGLGSRLERGTLLTPVVKGVRLTALSFVSTLSPNYRAIATNVLSQAGLQFEKTFLVSDITLERSSVRLETLDRIQKQLVRGRLSGRIWAIKIDAEGFESEILAGGTGFIDRFSPLIFCEGGNRHREGVLDEA